jgi:hypothetical protein
VGPGLGSPAATRAGFLECLLARRAVADVFVEEAIHARAQLV